ncbi:MAG: site-specific integrase [Deltaproteobacteria bacterium]|nr:site-specific integrase [Deltaproteobacteria bacterium]
MRTERKENDDNKKGRVGVEVKMVDQVLPAEWHEIEAPAVLKTSSGKEIKYIRRHEVQRILSCLQGRPACRSGRDRLLVEVLWNTGARISEVLELTAESVNFNQHTITIRSIKKRKFHKKAKDIRNEIRGLELALANDPDSKILQRKLDDARRRLSACKKEPPPPVFRTIPITADLSGKIAAYCMENSLKNHDRLFPISRVRAYHIIRRAGEKAGIDKDRCHPHVFRHGFAVNAVLSGVPPLVLRRWMGHARIETTLVYTEVLAQDTKDYLERMRF